MTSILRRGGKALAVLGILAVTALVAFAPARALVVDQTRTMNKRFFATQQTHYYRLTINYNDPNIGTAQMFGALGQNAFITNIKAWVTTAFNAGSTNVVSIGTSTAATEIIAGSGSNASITAGTTGLYALTAAPGLGVQATSAGDVTLYAKYAQTGTAATAGQVVIVIEYVPNNDM